MSKVRYYVSALVVSLGLVAGVATQEGKENNAYVDLLAKTPVVTVCYGHTATAKLGQTYTDTQCSELLRKDLNTVYAPIVRKYVKVPITQGQFDALVDFTYNLGEGNFRSSTLLAKVNAEDFKGAALEFERWYMSGGKDCRLPANRCGGIPKRRAWERQTFES